MPSPFPGMDPYMEDPNCWNGVLQFMTVRTASVLNALLPVTYVADIDVRLHCSTPDGQPLSDEIPDLFLKIFRPRDRSSPVTILYYLHIEQKTPGHWRRQSYLEWRHEVLAGPVNLIEIDLLRSGERTVAAPRIEVSPWAWHYMACVRSRERGYAVWPIHLRERLPTLPVPLASGEPEVSLDLQSVLDRVYDEGGYGRMIDYDVDPSPPLTPEDSEWAAALLRERGLRP